jgi:hypothetical protein
MDIRPQLPHATCDTLVRVDFVEFRKTSILWYTYKASVCSLIRADYYRMKERSQFADM